VIAVDTNILVYAHCGDSALHEPADRRLTELAESGEAWAIPWPCVHKFLAISTSGSNAAWRSTDARARCQSCVKYTSDTSGRQGIRA
jgi:predicted nucleic acid-binding protein